MLRELPPRARWYIITVIVIGAMTFAVLVPRAVLTPVLPLLFFVVLSSLTSAFKVQFPIASGSNMSVSYVVDIAALILRGPHAGMIVGAASGWTQSTFNQPKGKPNPLYRTLFNMAILVLTAQASGQVYRRLGGGASTLDVVHVILPLAGMALTYFLFNTVPIAVAIALSTNQHAFGIWKRELASSLPSYLLGAAAAAIVLAVTESSGIWFAVLLLLAPLYLTYKVYRTGADVEAKQGAILQAANDSIITMDSQLAIREFNPAAEKMFGYGRMDILGRNVDILLPPSDRAATVDALQQYLSTGKGPLAGKPLELKAVRADATEFPVELTVARVGAENSRAMTGFLRDISERRKLEEQLRQSQKLEAIGRLASGVAHDVNNVLMSIMGSADLILMDSKEGDPVHAETSEIKLSVQRGASLTRQLLAFSRRQATVPKRFMLREATAGMETMLRRLIGPEIDLQIIRSSDVMVMADPAQIEQVVLNLCVNARDAMPDGGRLTVSVEEVELNEWAAGLIGEDAKPGRYARLSVSDTGMGMDEVVRAKLFEPFFTTKEQGKGTGLGLSIVYGIVKQSGGHITVASEPGRGATFLIYLPLATQTTPVPPVEPAPA
ncbi:MAG TPA: ATP-binding protein [Vicinamibacterales bacterium]|nr:ATP-binding protein [Vicinamibacterales bacterium]